jgi:ABC-type polysaccharide/polyol phosphate export permease
MTRVATPTRPVADDEYAERHVYEPHRVGIPPLSKYLHELWKRREFAVELSRTTLRAQHYKSALGQLWLVVNPLMLALVYFILVSIIRGGARGPVYFAHLLAGLFAFHLFSQSVNAGAKSVVKGGKLILNTAFPRTLLPISAVMTAFMRFLPTMAVYAVMHAVAGLPVGPHLLWAIPILALIVIFSLGVATFVSAAQVYFRDVSSFLPYVMRIWLYSSPVLYYVEDVPKRFEPLIYANPLTPLLGSWSDVLILARAPNPHLMLAGAAWAVAALVVGMLFFISREREFAVRL